MIIIIIFFINLKEISDLTLCILFQYILKSIKIIKNNIYIYIYIYINYNEKEKKYNLI